MIEKTTILENYGQGAFTEYRIPAIIISRKGTILVAYESRENDRNDWANIQITIRRSTDDGQHFSAPIYPSRLLSGSTDKIVQTWNNPVLIADQEIIHLLFCQNYEKVWYCQSHDDGQNFSRPQEITSVFRQFAYSWNVCAVGPGHGFVSSHNRIIVPIWLANGKVRFDLDPTGRIKNHAPSVAGCIYSDDHGQTWQTGFLTSGIENANETTAAELKNGRILFNFRNERFEKCRVLGIAPSSLNELESAWSETSLPDPTCFGSMINQKDHLYFVNCANHNPKHLYSERIHLTLYQSLDQAASWQALGEIDVFGGYADISFKDEFAYIFYEHVFNGKVEKLQLVKYNITK